MGFETSHPVTTSPHQSQDITPLADDIPLTSGTSPTSQNFTVDDAFEGQGLGRFQLVLLALTGLCWTAESMEMLLLSFIKAPLQCQWGISDPQAALITTAVGIGMLTGATSWGLFSDKAGRRTGFILSTLTTFFAGLASAMAPNYTSLLIARGIVGFGIGGVPISFSLLMEFLPSTHRGRIGMGLALFWSLGAIFEAAVAMSVLPRFGWRALIAVSTLPLALVLLLSFFLSESPRWLLSKGRVDDAMRSLGRVSRVNGIPLPPGDLTHQVMATEEGKTRRFGQLGELLRKGVRTLAFKLWFLWFVVAFIYYGLIMLQPEVIAKENLGQRCDYAMVECGALAGSNATCTANSICVFTADASCTPRGTLAETEEVSHACTSQLSKADFLSTLWASVGELPGVIAAFLVVELVGRRPLVGYLFAITAVTFVLQLPCLGRKAETVIFFVARGGSSGVFQAVYLFTNEIYPSVIRASAMGFSSSVARMGLIVSPFIAQYVDNFNHAAAIWIYFSVTVLAILMVILIPIETTRRPLMGSMDELVAVIRDGEVKTGPSFAKDPGASAFVRFFRWPARIDGNGIS